MAYASVGGAFLSATLQVLFDRLASRQVLNFFKSQNLNDKLLKKLKMRMITVNKVLKDAESKEITDTFVKEWIDELKDAVYEADGFLDEVAYESMRLEVEAGSQTRTSTNQVLEILSSYNPFEREKAEMEAKLEEILEILDDLMQQKDALGLREVIGEKSVAAKKMPTTSLLDERGVYGREGDKEAIKSLVLSDDANCKQLDVIPIVGMGGVGKTTLAQLIYNDSTVQQRFDLKAWVCVSEEFDVFMLTKDILKEVGSATCDAMTANQLHCELEEKTAGKKVLLVLDDVRSEDQDSWGTLLTPLKSLRRGSKIIVTTRNDTVALVKSTVPIHRLNALTEDDCWMVFSKQAFDDGSSSFHPDLEKIGRKIVRKCDGLPLAAKAPGGLLRSKRDAKEWEKVLTSDLWNLRSDPVLPALQLSYYDLPSQLKQCFAYCALFPKDYRFSKNELIRLWMAQGFLVLLKGNEEIEEVGDEFFHDLSSRSFFQRYSSDDPRFIMHDLIHDLAKFVSREFWFLLENGDSNKIAEKARHFSYIPITRYGVFQRRAGMHGAQLLRTFLILSGSWEVKNIKDTVIHDLLPALKRLRVLSLSGYSSIVKFFNPMGKLKHLRYLNLAWTSIKQLPKAVGIAYNLQTLILEECIEFVELADTMGSLKYLRYMTLEGTKVERLPESMSDLYNLQTLILQECKNLMELPTGLGRLTNLCHLDIEGIKLLEMPSDLGELTKLKKLSDFFIGKQSGSSIKELGKLQNLHGNLCIRNLQNVVNAEDAAEADLKGKKQLESLVLIWDGDTVDSQHERTVLEKLEPNSNLKELRIAGYRGTKFPNWMGLVQSTVGHSTSPEEIDVGHHNLESLWAHQGSTMCPDILNLKQLVLYNCTKLKGLPEGMHFLLPSLEELLISKCPEVESFPKGGLPSKLQSLAIINCNKLIAGRMQWNLQSLPCLSKFTIEDNEEVESFLEYMLLPSTLTSLTIWRLKNLKALNEGIQQLTSLKRFIIGLCPELQSIPKERLPLSLSSLSIDGCPLLEMKWEKETGEYWPMISHIPNIIINYKKIN